MRDALQRYYAEASPPAFAALAFIPPPEDPVVREDDDPNATPPPDIVSPHLPAATVDNVSPPVRAALRALEAEGPSHEHVAARMRSYVDAEGGHRDALLCCAGCGTVPAPGEEQRGRRARLSRATRGPLPLPKSANNIDYKHLSYSVEEQALRY